MHLVVITYPRAWGGTEVLVSRIVERAAARGYRVTIVEVGLEIYGPRGLCVGSVRCIHRAGWLGSTSAKSWFQFLHRLVPDVVVLFKGHVDAHAMTLDLACMALRVRYVTVEAHLPPLPPLPAPTATLRKWLGVRKRRLLRGISYWLHSRAPTRIISLSAVIRDRLVRYYGFRPDIPVVHLGVDPIVFAPSHSQRLVQREVWGIDSEDVVIGAVGRVAPLKRLDWAVRAFSSHIRSGNRPAAWLVFGGEGEERAALEQLASNLGIAERVKFLGWVPSSSAVTASLDIYVLPSEAEGFGIALIESMASGCVCVATDSGGPHEIITDPSLGWLVPCDDEQAFDNAVQRAIAMSPTERAEMGKNARASVLARFEEARLNDQLLDEILGRTA